LFFSTLLNDSLPMMRNGKITRLLIRKIVKRKKESLIDKYIGWSYSHQYAYWDVSSTANEEVRKRYSLASYVNSADLLSESNESKFAAKKFRNAKSNSKQCKLVAFLCCSQQNTCALSLQKKPYYVQLISSLHE
jgi:hypothetical protein